MLFLKKKMSKTIKTTNACRNRVESLKLTYRLCTLAQRNIYTYYDLSDMRFGFWVRPSWNSWTNKTDEHDSYCCQLEWPHNEKVDNLFQ